MTMGIKSNYCIKLLLAAILTIMLLGLGCAAAAYAEEGESAPAPVINLLGEKKMEWPCGRPYEEPGFEAFDSEGKDCSELVEISGEVCVWKRGRYILQYSFTDSEGNTVMTRRLVKVVPVGLPEEQKREKVIYLSFDDGPCENTDMVLELLDKYDAKATFFVIGGGEQEYQDRIEKIHARGHQVGIHALNHDYGRLYSSEEYFFEDFMRMQDFVYEHTGSYATISRFPGGSETAYQFLGKRTEGGFDTIKNRLADMGVQYFDWNVQVEGDMARAGQDMINYFTRTVPEYDTPVCLQHDTLRTSVKILEDLLIWGTENGYTFAAIDTSTPAVQFR